MEPERPIHKAANVNRFTESMKGMLKLFVLPSYSLQPNADEVIWVYTELEVAKKVVECREEAKALVLSVIAHN